MTENTISQFGVITTLSRDILTPAQGAALDNLLTRVETSYSASATTSNYLWLIQHLIDYNNPHRTRLIDNVKADIIDAMFNDAKRIGLPSATTLADFTTWFDDNPWKALELLRRIVLNVYNYILPPAPSSPANLYYTYPGISSQAVEKKYIRYCNNSLIIDDPTYAEIKPIKPSDKLKLTLRTGPIGAISVEQTILSITGSGGELSIVQLAGASPRFSIWYTDPTTSVSTTIGDISWLDIEHDGISLTIMTVADGELVPSIFLCGRTVVYTDLMIGLPTDYASSGYIKDINLYTV